MKNKKRKAKIIREDTLENKAYTLIHKIRNARTYSILIAYCLIRCFAIVFDISDSFLRTRRTLSFVDILVSAPIGLAFVALEIHIRKEYNLPKFKFNAFSMSANLFIAVAIIIIEIMRRS